MKLTIGGEKEMKYVAPEMNIVMFETEEVIVASAEVATEAVTTTTEDNKPGGMF